ncbi:MAG: arylamine N-acetyltransferase, partial [Acidobacteria bacterium]|nr:arylamine N-acetyltransferase [Candidatus Sulfomarinibacter sp. MAG AM1]
MADAKTFERYLSILGIEAAPPGLDHLHRLVSAQLTRVPFENISKLFLKKTQGASYIPSLEQHLDGIERFSFGGTCYANNPYFSKLLRHLGYDVDMCGANMSEPDVHV